ncbi:hydrogenase nickel incorporation protein HypB [Anaeromyxobacter oryzae]|uniref:Hydrogenase accessory protein HypB n=1 Tax=Anaeromyxobacter oryzae TaxID=2918170 RepID=A0ABM7WPI9_9BACT|nr:hydrogenase nickel incorporation protein HypB [Anaeromyxobacter oryzae]BDG01377.1 hydrogenase accessory protein HypB [Anaeromyxobacter oryzae]
MCATCGCSGTAGAEHGAGDEHAHVAPHVHPHGHEHAPGAPWRAAASPRLLRLEQEVLGKNDRIAAENRAWLATKRVTALNLVSSPGAGKTTLLERTLRALAGEVPISVVEGDQETPLDAERIRATGCPVVQINTGRGCHLDAAMIADALRRLAPPAGSLLFVENVGNLVCPALFDLGERAKVVIASTPEGEEKPLKYPHMFRASALMLLNKVDLVPHVGFDVARCLANARQVNPRLEAIPISATRGDGLDAWLAWLRTRLGAASGR